MQTDDPHILAAMDGQEVKNDDASNLKGNLRSEPTAFFFVVFGLVFEALTTSSVDATSTTSSRQLTVIAALEALKSLVRPEYSGTAMMEPTTFDEFIGLCYRMAMTESAEIQAHLVEMLAILATTNQAKNSSSPR